MINPLLGHLLGRYILLFKTDAPESGERAFDAISTVAKERKRKDQKSNGPI